MMTNRTIVTIQYILKYYDIQHSPPPQVNAFVAKVSDRRQHWLSWLLLMVLATVNIQKLCQYYS